MSDFKFNPAWLDWSEPVKVYKDDARSRVWLIYCTLGLVVIKHFRHSFFKQRLSRLVGIHPAQRENRVTRQLARLGIPVVPILATGYHRGGYLASECSGESLYNILYNKELTSHTERWQLCHDIGELTGRLLAAGWTIRDYKASNILVDMRWPVDRIRLIDAGSGRRSRSFARILHMLATLDANVAEAGASRAERLCTLKVIIRHYPKLGNLKDVALAIAQKRIQ